MDVLFKSGEGTRDAVLSTAVVSGLLSSMVQESEEAASPRPAVLLAMGVLYDSFVFRSSIKRWLTTNGFFITGGPLLISDPGNSSQWKKTSRHILGEPASLASHCSMLATISWLVF